LSHSSIGLNSEYPASEPYRGEAHEHPSAHSPAGGSDNDGNLPPGPGLAVGLGRLAAVFATLVPDLLVLTPAIPDSPRDNLHGPDLGRLHPLFPRYPSGSGGLQPIHGSGDPLDHNSPPPA